MVSIHEFFELPEGDFDAIVKILDFVDWLGALLY